MTPRKKEEGRRKKNVKQLNKTNKHNYFANSSHQQGEDLGAESGSSSEVGKFGDAPTVLEDNFRKQNAENIIRGPGRPWKFGERSVYRALRLPSSLDKFFQDKVKEGKYDSLSSAIVSNIIVSVKGEEFVKTVSENRTLRMENNQLKLQLAALSEGNNMQQIPDLPPYAAQLAYADLEVFKEQLRNVVRHATCESARLISAENLRQRYHKSVKFALASGLASEGKKASTMQLRLWTMKLLYDAEQEILPKTPLAPTIEAFAEKPSTEIAFRVAQEVAR